MSGEDRTNRLAEWIRGILALFVVIGGLVIIFSFFWSKGADLAKDVATIVSGMIGLVLGYYFGTKGIENVARAANNSERAAHQAVSTADLERRGRVAAEKTSMNLRQLQQKVTEYEGLIDEYENIIGQLSSAVKGGSP
jgi:hypothetical protein